MHFRPRTCWARATDIRIAGPLLGIGWGPPILDRLAKVSSRWIGGARAASLFVRVPAGLKCHLCFTVQYADPVDFGTRLHVRVCGRMVETWFSRDDAGRTVLGVTIPEDLTSAYGGRLWLQLGYGDADQAPAAGRVALSRVYSIDRELTAPRERF